MSLFNKFFGKQRLLKEAAKIPVKTDIHSHLIPNIDDGSQSMEESIKLITELKSLGFKKLITTPHIMSDYFKNDHYTIGNGLKMLMQEVNERKIEIEIEAASEYYIDEHFMKLIEKNELLWFGDKYVLVETNTINFNQYIRNAFFELGLTGYRPVLAHPERYTYMWNNFDRYYEFRDQGILFQINLISLSGFYSQKVKEVAEKMIDENLVNFIGTDTHEMRYIDGLKQAMFNPYMLKLQEMNLLNDTL